MAVHSSRAATNLFLLFIAFVGGSTASAQESDPSEFGFRVSLQPFVSSYCNDCHADGADEGGLAIDQLSTDLDDPAVFARWEQIYDRVQAKEMPPADADQPSPRQRSMFASSLSKPLNENHRTRSSTVLRRLNRREYQNTLNDVFGTHLDLESLLPEDARSHEFDNVGDALGLSMVHLQRYMDAAQLVLDTAIAKDTKPPEQETISAWYKDTREAEQHVGKSWKLLDDGYVVRFEGGGYPSGMLRNTSVNRPGRYRIRVTGYAYQSDQPIVFSVGGTSFVRGSEKPIYGFYQFPPGDPTTIELEAWIGHRYMIAIEPHEIFHPNRYKKGAVDEYSGPGLAIGEVSLEGPLFDQYPSKGHQLVFNSMERVEIPPRNPRDRFRRGYQPKFEIKTEDANAVGTEALLRVAKTMMRQPVRIDEIATYRELFRERLQAGDSIEQSLRTAIVAMLCSPRFLYFQESPGALDAYAIANRLSYFLNRTLPDAQLIEVASTGALQNQTELHRQTDRLIRHEKFSRFLTDFTDNWLDLREIDFTAPDRKLFPEFDAFLRDSMLLETRAFVREVIESNLPIRSLIDPGFAMLNSRLAVHYDLPAVDGVAVRKVILPKDSLRGGLLSQASILKVTANGTNTSPVTRGAWVLERIAGVTPPPPPPGVPGVEPDIRGATTLRELLDKHRNSVNCRACHRKIDPPGFALESFNPIGGFRRQYRSLGEGDRIETQIRGRRVAYRLGPDVDPSGELVDGTPFGSFGEFRDLLASQDRMVAKTFVTKLLTFATGREMGFSDRPEINQIVTTAAENEYRAKDLLHAVVASEIFNSK